MYSFPSQHPLLFSYSLAPSNQGWSDKFLLRGPCLWDWDFPWVAAGSGQSLREVPAEHKGKGLCHASSLCQAQHLCHLCISGLTLIPSRVPQAQPSTLWILCTLVSRHSSYVFWFSGEKESLPGSNTTNSSPALPWLPVVRTRQGSRTRQETDPIKDPSEGD